MTQKPTPPAVQVWHTLNAADVLAQFKTDPHTGLTTAQVQQATATYGPNELVEAPGRTFLELVLDQVKNVLVLMLIGAAVVATLSGDTKSAIAIAVIVIFNTILGVVQESRAEQAMAALKRMAAPVVRVRRDGKEQEIPAKALVPGDIILLEAGNSVPADARLIDAVNLRAREAALTGEATTVGKTVAAIPKPDAPLGDRTNLVFMGTEITNGRGAAVVYATGMSTELGKIATLIQAVPNEPSPLQRRMARLGTTLVVGALGVIALIMIGGVLAGGDLRELALSVISIAVAVVPEGLPAVITITLALGAQRMVKRNVLIRKLPAVETLGSVTTIASDKTGTLTQNKMIVEVAHTAHCNYRFTGHGYSPKGQILQEEKPIAALNDDLHTLLTAAVLCNDATLTIHGDQGEIIGDPTEAALLVAGAKGNLIKETLRTTLPRIGEAPFTSERKRMSVIVENKDGMVRGALGQGRYLLFIKGSPELVLARCTAALVNGMIQPLDGLREEALRTNDEMAGNGVRVLGFAARILPERPEAGTEEMLETELVWLGMIGMIDAPRPEVRNAVAVCYTAGIRPIMITGDHRLTALAIARDLGIVKPGQDRVVTGPELEAMSDATLESIVEEVNVYARVSPEHKLRIVRALQNKGQFVAMTGDGVNDAPALKQANIGVAMGITGTDVSKGASDMILTDDNFASIVAATEEGRTIYGNVRKFIRYILTSNIGEVLTLAAAPVLGLGGLPLTPVQILYMNLVTDGLPALALAVDPAEKDVMKKKPYGPKESIFSRGLGAYMLRVGVVFGIIATAFMLFVYRAFPDTWQTMVFTMLCLSQMGHAIAVRSEKQSIFQIGWLTNKWLLLAVFVTTALQMALVYIAPLADFFGLKALPLDQLLICFAASTLLFFWVEGEKFVLRRLRKVA